MGEHQGARPDIFHAAHRGEVQQHQHGDEQQPPIAADEHGVSAGQCVWRAMVLALVLLAVYPENGTLGEQSGEQ